MTGLSNNVVRCPRGLDRLEPKELIALLNLRPGWGNQVTDRRTALLRSMLPTGGRGLEIGPGYNPLLPKVEGFRVETVDYTDADGLRMKYHSNPYVDIGRIETVDHVMDEERTLAETVGQPGTFDYVVASHVMEHTPDMLGFLKSCEELLAPRGVLLLAIPDKRHCFDVLQPLASTGAVLQAHLDRRTRPTPGTVFDEVAYNAVRGDAIGWAPHDSQPLRFFASLCVAAQAYQSARRLPYYQDVHVWRFVPSSFRLIAQDLNAIGEIFLREDQFHDSVGNEFYVTLSRHAAGCPVDRLSLAKQALREQALILLD
jgi:SAM-dependent methyltransferase